MSSTNRVAGRLDAVIHFDVIRIKSGVLSRRTQILIQDNEGHRSWVAAGDTIALKVAVHVDQCSGHPA